MKRWIWVCTVLALLPVAQAGGGGPVFSCPGAPRIDTVGLQKRLAAAEALWQRRGLKHYSMNTAVTGQLGFDVVVAVHADKTVRGQMITRPLRLPGQPAVAPVTREASGSLAHRYAVPGLFAQVQRLLDQFHLLTPSRRSPPALPGSGGLPPCGVLNVTFDPRDGHVRSLQNDSFGVIDDEFLLTTSALTPEP